MRACVRAARLAAAPLRTLAPPKPQPLPMPARSACVRTRASDRVTPTLTNLHPAPRLSLLKCSVFA